MLRGEGIALEALEGERYAAPRFWKTCVAMGRWRERKMPQSYLDRRVEGQLVSLKRMTESRVQGKSLSEELGIGFCGISRAQEETSTLRWTYGTLKSLWASPVMESASSR